MGERLLATMAAEVGAHRSVLVAGGWLHNPLVRAVKQRQYGGFGERDLHEPGGARRGRAGRHRCRSRQPPLVGRRRRVTSGLPGGGISPDPRVTSRVRTTSVT